MVEQKEHILWYRGSTDYHNFWSSSEEFKLYPRFLKVIPDHLQKQNVKIYYWIKDIFQVTVQYFKVYTPHYLTVYEKNRKETSWSWWNRSVALPFFSRTIRFKAYLNDFGFLIANLKSFKDKWIIYWVNLSTLGKNLKEV